MLKGIDIIRGQRFLIHFLRFIICLSVFLSVYLECMTKLQYLIIGLYFLCI